MKKFYQIESYPKGDCFRTCIACILEVDKLEDVPNFMKDGEELFDSFYKNWLDKNGYMEISYEIDKSKLQGKNFDGQLCILSGINLDTLIRHSVIGRVEYKYDNNTIEYFIVHDPAEGNDSSTLEIDFCTFIVSRLDIKKLK